MTFAELARELGRMWGAAPATDKTVQVHLFGIRHARDLQGYTLRECCDLAEAAGRPKSMGQEIHKMIKLSKFVKEAP
ncbi:MAG: hypothetical protein NXH82_07300 [Rhodobacteraceae bacterium]|nr:hypothetical protein [Paracoccaceae bacterium]